MKHCVFFVVFAISMSCYGQKLQLQKNMESVDRVIQSPDGAYLLTREINNYTLIDQKSKIQLASKTIESDAGLALGEGTFAFYDHSKFILNSARNLLLVDLLGKKIDTLNLGIKFPEFIENFIVIPNSPNQILITTKTYPINKDGTVSLLEKKGGNPDISNGKLIIYDISSNKIVSLIKFPYSVTSLVINDNNEILAGTFDGNIIKIFDDLQYKILFKAFDKPVHSIVSKKESYLIIPHIYQNKIYYNGAGQLYFFDKSFNLKKTIVIPVPINDEDKTDLGIINNVKPAQNNFIANVLNPKDEDFVYLNYGLNGLLKIDVITSNYSNFIAAEKSAAFYCLNFDNSQIIASINDQTNIFGVNGKLYLFDVKSQRFIDAFRKVKLQKEFQTINKTFYNNNYYYVAQEKPTYNSKILVFKSNSNEETSLSGQDITYNNLDNSLLLMDYDRLVYGTLKLDDLTKKSYNFKFKNIGWGYENKVDSLNLDIFTPIIDIANYRAKLFPSVISFLQRISDDIYLISGRSDKYYDKKTVFTFFVINSKGDILFKTNENIKGKVINEIRISPSGKYIAVKGEMDSEIYNEVWDWKSNKLVYSKIYKKNFLIASLTITFDKSKDTYWFSEYNTKSSLYDIYNINFDVSEQQPKIIFSNFEKFVDNFLPDEKNDLIYFNEEVYKLSTQKLFWTFENDFNVGNCSGIQALVNGVGLLYNNSFITIDPNFKTIYFTTYDDKSLEINSDLLYKADKAVINNLGFVINGKGYLPSDYDYYFNRPDIIIKESGSTNDEYQKLIEKAVLKRTNSLKKANLNDLFEKAPLMTITNTKSINAFTKSNSQQFDLSFTPNSNRFIRSYAFYVNGVNVVTTELLKKESAISQNIILSQGKNLIQINCTDNEGYISNTETYTIYADYKEDNPKVYVVIIAADTYDNPDFNLKYSVKDANDLVDHLKKRYGANLIVSTLINKNANEELINQIKNTVKEANVNDKIIVFVSGHGVLDSNLDFRFATPNMDFSKPNEFGITSKTLESILLASPARNKLLMIDACHSGEFDKEEYSNTISTDAVVVSYSGSKGSIATSSKTNTESSFELMRQLFNDVSEKSGIKVISAAAGNSFALESEQWKNGVFTYSLLSVLENNKTISISKLSKEVAESVIKLTNSKQKPTNRGNTVEFDFEL